MAPKRLLVLATSAVALLASSTACSSDDTASGDGASGELNLAVFASLNGAPAYAGDAEGVFDAHELDVTLSTAKTSTEMVPQLVGGKVDIALLDTATSLMAIGQGVDLVYVAGGTDGGVPQGQEEFSFANVWVQKDSPIKTMADLSGRSVAIPQIKSQPWLDLRASVDEAGGDSASIEFVESPDPLGALKSKQVDATTTPEPLGTIERAKDELRVLGPTISGGGGPAYVYVATRKFAEANPEVVESFADAIRETNAQVNDDQDLLVSSASKLLGADAELLAQAALPVYAEEALSEEDIEFSIGYLDRYDMFGEGAPAVDEVLFRP